MGRPSKAARPYPGVAAPEGDQKDCNSPCYQVSFSCLLLRDNATRFLTPFFIVLKLVWTSSSQFLMWVEFCRNIRMCKKIHGVRNSMKGHIDRKKMVKLNQWLFGGKVLYHLNVNDISHSLHPINKYSWKFQFFKTVHLLSFFSWALLSALSVGVVALYNSRGWPVNTRTRKIFHLAILLVYTSGSGTGLAASLRLNCWIWVCWGPWASYIYIDCGVLSSCVWIC